MTLTSHEAADLDIDGTAGHISRGGFAKVALQFPDGLLPLASRAEAAPGRTRHAVLFADLVAVLNGVEIKRDVVTELTG